MSISLVNATYTGIDQRLSLKVNEAYHIHVYSDAQFPIVVEIKDFKKRYPYTCVENFLASWKNISKIAELGR